MESKETPTVDEWGVLRSNGNGVISGDGMGQRQTGEMAKRLGGKLVRRQVIRTPWTDA